MHWSLCSRLGRCLRCLCMITGLGNGLSAQLLTCSHILGGFCRTGNRTANKSQRGALIVDSGCAVCRRLSAVATGGIPERCVPGTPSGKHRPLRVRFPLPSLCSTANIPRLLLWWQPGATRQVGSGRWERFTHLNSRCRYAREPPVGIEPTTIRLRSACSTS